MADQLAALLRAFGEGAFDMEGATAEMTRARADAWARHLLLGTPNPDRPDEPATRRDWAGMRHWFTKHRAQERSFVARSLSEFRQLVWSFVHDVHRAVSHDEEADQKSRLQLDRLRNAVHKASVEELRREALQTTDMLATLIAEREQRRKEQMQSLGEQLQAMGERLEEAKRTSEQDALTGLFNRRALDSYVQRVAELDGITGMPACVLMVDLDHFKSLNDTHGHAFGDLVLKEVADKLAHTFLRKCDFVSRYGGEEFTVIMRDTGMKPAEMVAERFRQALAKLALKPGLFVTASIGIAELRHNESAQSWMERADKAMYNAKQNGRDRILRAA